MSWTPFVTIPGALLALGNPYIPGIYATWGTCGTWNCVHVAKQGFLVLRGRAPILPPGGPMIPGIETDLPGRTPHETGRKPHYTGARARDALVTLARLLGVSFVRVFFLSHKFPNRFTSRWVLVTSRDSKGEARL